MMGKFRAWKNSGSWTLPLDVAIISWGYAGWSIRISLWKYVIESRSFCWPGGRLLLHCKDTPHHLSPCIKRSEGGIFGTPHGDFWFSSIGIYWLIWRWEKDLNNG